MNALIGSFRFSEVLAIWCFWWLACCQLVGLEGITMQEDIGGWDSGDLPTSGLVIEIQIDGEPEWRRAYYSECADSGHPYVSGKGYVLEDEPGGYLIPDDIITDWRYIQGEESSYHDDLGQALLDYEEQREAEDLNRKQKERDKRRAAYEKGKARRLRLEKTCEETLGGEYVGKKIPMKQMKRELDSWLARESLRSLGELLAAIR